MTSEPSKFNALESSYEKKGEASLFEAFLCFLQLKLLQPGHFSLKVCPLGSVHLSPDTALS